MSQKYTFNEDIHTFYETGIEKDRLDQGMGQLEKFRTQKLLNQFLPKSPASIADVGGGMGVYAFELAQKGYEVYLIDPVAFNIDEAKKIGKENPSCPLKAYIVGDARKIDLKDNSVDVVLFFGPLYHLNPQDRLIALQEAYRILQPGGTLCAVAISRAAPLSSFIKKGKLPKELEESIIDSFSNGKFTYKGGLFFSHFPNQLQQEIEKTGFEKILLRAIEGLGSFLNNENLKNEKVCNTFMTLIEQTEKEPSTLGISNHIMAIARKPRDQELLTSQQPSVQLASIWYQHPII